MRSSTTFIAALALTSTVSPILAHPIQSTYSPDLAKREEQFARELAYILVRADESGALSWQQVKDFGKKAWTKAANLVTTVAPVVGVVVPVVMDMMHKSPKARDFEGEALWARLE